MPKHPSDDLHAHEVAVRTAAIAENIPDVKRCIEGEALFFAADTQARVPGHIYSEAGKKEAAISGACEYHFDLWFGEDD